MSDVVVLPAAGDLAGLAAQVNREHAACLAAGTAFAEHAYRCGELLIEAKAAVRHGEWLPWLAENFAADESTARRYMQVAATGDRACVHDLSLTAALREIASAPKPALAPVVPLYQPQPPSSTHQLYRTIVADPPWQYDNKATRGAAEDHYRTMSIDQLCDPVWVSEHVPALGDSHLYLWTTNGFLRQAFGVMDAWGFTYKTCLTWVKPQLGIGNYFRGSSEHVLFGVRGRLPMSDSNQPTWFQAPRTRHSAKPDSFYDLVERVSAGPYLELFSRQRRIGWDSWGNEV